MTDIENTRIEALRIAAAQYKAEIDAAETVAAAERYATFLDADNLDTPIFKEVLAEVERAEAKFGKQYDIRGGSGDTIIFLYSMRAHSLLARDRYATLGELCYLAREQTRINAENGTLTWRDILLEEVFEAVCEETTAGLRAELVQVAAVAVRWIDALDQRGES